MVKGCKWDDAAGGYVSFVFGQDNYPLMAPFDIDRVISDLPEEATPSWTPSHAPQLENTKPFLTALVIAASAIVVFAATGLLVYFKKHPLKLGGNNMRKIIALVYCFCPLNCHVNIFNKHYLWSHFNENTWITRTQWNKQGAVWVLQR
jgi:hypothetical protein